MPVLLAVLAAAVFFSFLVRSGASAWHEYVGDCKTLGCLAFRVARMLRYPTRS